LKRLSVRNSGQWIKAVCLVAAGGLAASLLESNHADASQAMYVFKSLVFAAMDLITSHPLTLGLGNAGVALLLLLVRGTAQGAPGLFRRLLSSLVLQLNRSAGHLEALFTWLTLVIWWAPALWLQAVGVLVITVLAPVAIDSVTNLDRGPPRWSRLLVPAAVTLAGVALVISVDWRQWRQLAPLVALVLAGLVPRTAWSLWKGRLLHADSTSDSSWPHLVDRLVMAAALTALVIVPLRALKLGHRASLENRLHRTHHWQSCAENKAGEPAFSLFIVADSHFHALDGERSGFHLDAVDAEIPVSVRPVELDLLSSVTLRAFADVYQGLRQSRPGLEWVHLGDSADIGCASEIDRFVALAPRFGLGELAAAVPGNHDGAFLGNLAWHPDWDAACHGGRSSPAFARERLAGLMPQRKDRVVSHPDKFLATVTALGKIGAEDVVGVFLDTTDVPRDRVGIAGVQGGISDAQLEWVQETLEQFPAGRVLVFGHHPVDQWTRLSRKRLDRLALSLGNRLWGLVSAHTHLAAMRRQQVGGQTVPELIVGSTLDPPQEAALLEGGLDGHLTLLTLPAVRREEMTCPDDAAGTVSAQTCRQVFAELRQSKACEPLFGTGGSRGGSGGGGVDAGVRLQTSPECEKTVAAWAPLLEPGRGHAASPEELDCIQEVRAQQLLSCLGASTSDPAPLHDPSLSQRVLAASERDPDSWVCLSWAASVLQSHKREHWSYAQAIDFCLDPSATYGELEARWPSTD
jgi:hypothetical protein